MRFVEHRVGDRRVLRLIRGWLRAGVVEDGVKQAATKGTPQGAVISPLLANIYLHYAYDLWTEQWRKRQATGAMVVVRYADDTVVGFEHRSDADAFLAQLRIRVAEFALELHPEKTRLIEFGRGPGATGRRGGTASRRRSTSWALPISARAHGRAASCSPGIRGAIGSRRSCWRSGRTSDGVGTRAWLNRARGWGRWFEASLPITPCQQTRALFRRSVIISSIFGVAPCAGVAKETAQHGDWWTGWQTAGSPGPGYPIPGRLNASASNTQGGSRMREFRPYGSARGAPSNGRPYRD